MIDTRYEVHGGGTVRPAISATAARFIARFGTWPRHTDLRIVVPLTGARVPLEPPAKPHACGIMCTGAGLGTECLCECGGLYHATAHLDPPLRPGYRAPRADPFARLPAVDDEAW